MGKSKVEASYTDDGTTNGSRGRWGCLMGEKASLRDPECKGIQVDQDATDATEAVYSGQGSFGKSGQLGKTVKLSGDGGVGGVSGFGDGERIAGTGTGALAHTIQDFGIWF